MICSLSLHQTAVLSGGAAYRMGLCVCMWLFLLFLITCQYLITGDILCKNRPDFSLNEKNKRSFNTGPVSVTLWGVSCNQLYEKENI